MTQIFDFLKSEAGKRILNWLLSSGIGLVVLSLWVYALSQKQERLEMKMDIQSQEIKTMFRYQNDTLHKTLQRTNRILERYSTKSK